MKADISVVMKSRGMKWTLIRNREVHKEL